MKKKLTSEDYTKWYNEIVQAVGGKFWSEGCILIKPYGYAIWKKCKLNP